VKLRIKHVERALHPSERVVEIDTYEGPSKLVVDDTTADMGFIEVGAALSERNGHSLVELPRETFTGEWRVWVPRQNLEGAEEAS
jgi:hypothetical protein